MTRPRRSATPIGARIAGLRQKTLFRIAAAYAVAAWLVIQVAATVAPAFELSGWFLRAVILLALLGFVATVGFFAFLRPVDGASASEPASRRKRLIAVAAAGALIVAVTAGVAMVARTTMFGAQPVSLAVLPFADLSPQRDKAYFAEGVAEEILSSLGAEKGFKVLGRTSARQLERTPDPGEVRRKLGVTHLLEGSARTAGDALRVNVRLIDTGDGSSVWEEEYDGRLADIFAVQDKIAGAVVRRLRGTLSTAQPVRAATSANVDAYQMFLAARAIMHDSKTETLTQALRIARQIIAAHPDYAPGQALYAEAISLLSDGPYSLGKIPEEQANRITLIHARRAIRLAPNLADGYASLALALPWQERLAPLKRAIALDPSRAALRVRLAIALDNLDRNDEAFEQYREAAEIEPLSPPAINRYIQVLASSGLSDEALRVIETFRRRSGKEGHAWRFRGAIAGYRSDLSGDIAARRRALRLDPQLPYQQQWLAATFHHLGLDQEAERYDGAPVYTKLSINGDLAAFKARLERDGASAWAAENTALAIFALARSGDWPTIVRFYDLRPEEWRKVCVVQRQFALYLAITLERGGRNAESRQIRECMQQRVTSQLAMRYRSPEDRPGELEMWQASLLALKRDREAIAWLDRAVKRGWLGQYYSSKLADWTQFDALRGDPRMTVLQRRIDATIARERAETLRDLGRPQAE